MYITPQPKVSTAHHCDTGPCVGSQQGMEVFPSTALSTTQTFTTTHGFVIPTPPASSLPPRAADGSKSSGSSNSSSSGDAAANNKQQPSTPVGWSGLLEISRSGGCSGLVGSAAGSSDEELEGHIEVACTAHASTGVRRLVKSVVRGIKARQDPEAAREGMGGTYFFTNEAGRKVAIFKPCDEEPLAPANPKGYVGRNLGDPGWKSTVRVGEAAMREVAAYLLDHDHFAQVPHTVLVRARHTAFNYKYSPTAAGSGGGEPPSSSTSTRAGSVNSMVSVTTAAEAPAAAAAPPRDSSGGAGGCSGSPSDQRLKLGSLQEFVYHIADTSEFGASRFCMRDVHAIGILDVRLFNTDRHAGNILVRQPQMTGSARDLTAFNSSSSRTVGTRPPSLISATAAAAAVASSDYELIPIDHGFCLPEALDAPYFEWLHWPQACLPFSEEELRYIARLDAAADVALLQQELPNLRPECLRVLEVSTNFLQRCAAAGLSLADIGALASRPLDALDGDDSNPSELEKACIAARQAVETRELAASMLSSSYSSDGLPTAVLEENEEDLLEEDCSSSSELLEPPEQQGSPMLLSSSQQGQQGGPGGLARPSRLGVMSAACSSMELSGAQQVVLEQQQQEEEAGGLAGSGKVPSGDMGSVVSEATACNMPTAMSLGRLGADGDLLFDLDDDSGSGSGSSAAHTPVGTRPTRVVRGSSPLGHRVPAAAAGGGFGAAAAAAVAEDVDMPAAGSLREAEALSAYLRTTVQLQSPAASAFAGLAVAEAAAGAVGGVVGCNSNSGAGDAAAAAAAAGLPNSSDSGSGCLSPTSLNPALSTPVSSGCVNVARSVQANGDGWMLRGLKGKAGLATVGRCMNVKKGPSAAARRRTVVHRNMYPPPVVRAPPRAANEVLRGLSDTQWAAFMEELLAYMDDALRPGKGAWRGASQAAGLGNVAMSCPRF